MAQKAKKDRAKSNVATLNNLHLGGLVFNVLFLIFRIFKSRSMLGYVMISVPSFICQFVLEKSGRPKYEPTGALRSAGEDLASPGLTEYMFDVIWITWGTLVLVVLFGNALFFVWLIIPAYGAYKGIGLAGMARNMAAMQGGGDPAGSQQAAGNRKQRRAA